MKRKSMSPRMGVILLAGVLLVFAGSAWVYISYLHSASASVPSGTVWSDDFDRYNTVGEVPTSWLMRSGKWVIESDGDSNRVVAQTALDGKNHVMVNGDSNHGNYNLTVQVQPGSGDRGGGIIGRYVDEYHYYVLYFAEGDKVRFAMQNGPLTFKVLETAEFHYDPAKTYTLRLYMNGYYFEGYVDDERLLFHSNDIPVKRGQFGLSCTNHCVFDDMSVNIAMNNIVTTYMHRTVTFDNWEAGSTYDHAMLETDMGNGWGVTGIERLKIAANPDGKGNSFQYEMPKDGYNVFGSGGNIVPWLTGMTEVTMTYDVYFDSNGHDAYDWDLGGHMIGFGGGVVYDGDEDGAQGDGMKARLAFRDAGGGKGRMTPYVYHADMPGSYGDNFGASFGALESNTWQQIKLYVKLNDPRESVGEGTGVFKVWLDGEVIYEKTDIRYRVNSLFRIDKLMGDFFHGGNTPEFGPDYDQYVYIDNVTIDGAK